jgi:hypothetical protein
MKHFIKEKNQPFQAGSVLVDFTFAGKICGFLREIGSGKWSLTILTMLMRHRSSSNFIPQINWWLI